MLALLSLPVLRRLQVLETLRSSPRQWYLVALWPLTTQEREFRALQYTKPCAVSRLQWQHPLRRHWCFTVHPAYHLLGDAGRGGVHIMCRHSGCCMPAVHGWSGRPLRPVCLAWWHTHTMQQSRWPLHSCATCLMTLVHARPMLLVKLAGSLFRCWSISCSLACCSNGS